MRRRADPSTATFVSPRLTARDQRSPHSAHGGARGRAGIDEGRNAMKKIISRIAFGCAALCLVGTAAQAQINGMKVNQRVFNDYPASTANVTTNNTIPGGTATIDDRNMTNATGTGANRHDVLLSTDHGATAATFGIGQGFTIQADVTLTDGSNTPRKETGLRINSPVTGDALFIINSDAGEIVAFGGGAPFYNFRSPPFSEAAYVPGQTITLGETYRPGNGTTPGTMEYFIKRGANPVESSGPLAWSNLEGGPVNYQVAMYGQGGSNNNANDFLHVNFTNISASLVPEPASIGALAIGGLSLLARRRRD